MWAKLVFVRQDRLITYYTVEVWEDGGTVVNLFGAYLEQLQDPARADEKRLMLRWIQNIGRYGYKDLILRGEDKADAIPPKYKRGWLPRGFDVGLSQPPSENPPWPRLYIARFDNAIILYSGGLKWSYKAQDCDVVRPHFEMANRIGRVLNRDMDQGDRHIGQNGNLLRPEDFEI